MSESNHSHNWRGEYNQNRSLQRIYAFLQEIGYQPSDEELALLDGTHELYLKEDAQ